MNICVFSGFIGKKGIELKYAGETPVSNYSLAVQKIVKGEKQYTYVNCVTWGKPAEFLKNNEDKIKSLIVEAEFNTRSYEGNNGKVYINEFITLPGKVEVKEWNNDDKVDVLNNDGFIELPTDDEDLPWK